MINRNFLAVVVHDIQDEHAVGINHHNKAVRMLESDSIDAFCLLFKLMEARKGVKFLTYQLFDLVNQFDHRLGETAILFL